MTNKKGYRDMPELKPTTEALMRADAMIADLTAQNAMLKLQNDAKDIEIANLKGIIESAHEKEIERQGKGCEYCDAQLYMRVERMLLPALAPLTYADELEHELINVTGKDYVKTEKRYCHVCGRELKED